jgi:hypothetical protein
MNECEQISNGHNRIRKASLFFAFINRYKDFVPAEQRIDFITDLGAIRMQDLQTLLDQLAVDAMSSGDGQ